MPQINEHMDGSAFISLALSDERALRGLVRIVGDKLDVNNDRVVSKDEFKRGATTLLHEAERYLHTVNRLLGAGSEATA